MTTLEQVTNSKKSSKFLDVHRSKTVTRDWLLDFANRQFAKWKSTGINESLALVRVDEDLRDYLPL
jgi:hypothetical protein